MTALTTPPKSPVADADSGTGLTASQIQRLCQISRFHAARAGRRLGLAAADREDLGQDIVVIVLGRLKHFDPRRGPFGAFVDLVAANAAGLLLNKLKQRHSARAELTLDVSISETSLEVSGQVLVHDKADLTAEETYESADIKHGLTAALTGAPPWVVETFFVLASSALDHRVRLSGSRATWSRRRRRLRLWLLAEGVAIPLHRRGRASAQPP